jgi:hypothetical protein
VACERGGAGVRVKLAMVPRTQNPHGPIREIDP